MGPGLYVSGSSKIAYQEQDMLLVFNIIVEVWEQSASLDWVSLEDDTLWCSCNAHKELFCYVFCDRVERSCTTMV
jgi:hypothetical protein